MSADWPIVILGDYCSKIGSGATPRGGSSVYLNEGEICLIRSQNIYNDGFKPDGLVFITEDSADKLKNVIIEEDDILLNITGDSVARVCLAKTEYLPARVNQHVATIRPKPNEFDARFLRYFLVSPKMQNLLLVIASAGATRNALTKGMIESLEVPKPPLEVQISIANNLSSLDQKIEINRQINQTLESMAQAIFKSWFVDFEPVKAKISALESGEDAEGVTLAAMRVISGKTDDEIDKMEGRQPEDYAKLKTTAELFPAAMQDSELGEVPEGWEVKRLEDFISLQRGLSYKGKGLCNDGIPMVNLGTIAPNSGFLYKGLKYYSSDFKERNLVKPGDLVIANTDITQKRDVIGSPAIVPSDLGSNEILFTHHIYAVRNKSTLHNLYIYYLLQLKKYKDRARGFATGTTVLSLPDDAILDFNFVTPDKIILTKFTELTDKIRSKNNENIIQDRNLAQIRDTLLPKLLSGDILVKGER